MRSHAVPLGGSDGVKRGNPAVGVRGAGVGAEVAARDAAHAVHTEGSAARAAMKGIEVVAAIGGWLRREQEMDELFALVEADFLAMDWDGDGVISAAELRRVGMQRSLSRARVDKFLREADANQDGVLGFSEFLATVSSLDFPAG